MKSKSLNTLMNTATVVTATVSLAVQRAAEGNVLCFSSQKWKHILAKPKPT